MREFQVKFPSIAGSITVSDEMLESSELVSSQGIQAGANQSDGSGISPKPAVGVNLPLTEFSFPDLPELLVGLWLTVL